MAVLVALEKSSTTNGGCEGISAPNGMLQEMGISSSGYGSI